MSHWDWEGQSRDSDLHGQWDNKGLGKSSFLRQTMSQLHAWLPYAFSTAAPDTRALPRVEDLRVPHLLLFGAQVAALRLWLGGQSLAAPHAPD